MKKIFLALLSVLPCSAAANRLSAISDPVMNPYIQRPYLAGYGINDSSTSWRVYKVSNRWGAIYANPANAITGYSENNAEGYRSVNKEALVNCIKAGEGKNPIASDDKGRRKMVEVHNSCNAVTIGSTIGNGGVGIKSDGSLGKAEQKALVACSEYSNKYVIKYSGCSHHPDYRANWFDSSGDP